MGLKKFSFEWWDNREWAKMEGTILAETREQAESHLRSNAHVDPSPTYGRGEKVDSLRLVYEEEVENPPCFTVGPRRQRFYN